jgi:hypothetical protein
VHVGVFNYLAGMGNTTIVIANINTFCASVYDPSCDMTNCALIISIDRERRCSFAVNIAVELKQSLCFTGAFGTTEELGFEG